MIATEVIWFIYLISSVFPPINGCTYGRKGDGEGRTSTVTPKLFGIALVIHRLILTWHFSIMQLHILISALFVRPSLIAAGPLSSDLAMSAQTAEEIKSCADCAPVCGLCPSDWKCPACFDRLNCYACPFMDRCRSGKIPCPCYDFCSKGSCDDKKYCVSDVDSPSLSVFDTAAES